MPKGIAKIINDNQFIFSLLFYSLSAGTILFINRLLGLSSETNIGVTTFIVALCTGIIAVSARVETQGSNVAELDKKFKKRLNPKNSALTTCGNPTEQYKVPLLEQVVITKSLRLDQIVFFDAITKGNGLAGINYFLSTPGVPADEIIDFLIHITNYCCRESQKIEGIEHLTPPLQIQDGETSDSDSSTSSIPSVVRSCIEDVISLSSSDEDNFRVVSEGPDHP